MCLLGSLSVVAWDIHVMWDNAKVVGGGGYEWIGQRGR